MDGEFGKMDADKDKVVTRIEIEQFLRAVAVAEGRARSRTLFGQLDLDKNSQLSIVEFERMAVAPPPPNAAPVLNQADLNRDGRITLVEYRTNKLANFDRVDTDKDGVVSVMEMKAAGVVK
jgi:Ca2+-binding EF-hand superfamily protein